MRLEYASSQQLGYVRQRTVTVELADLAKLHDDGVLDDAEWRDLKATIIFEYKKSVNMGATDETKQEPAKSEKDVVKKEYGEWAYTNNIMKALFPSTVVIDDEESQPAQLATTEAEGQVAPEAVVKSEANQSQQSITSFMTLKGGDVIQLDSDGD